MTRLALVTVLTVVAIGVLLVASFPFRAIIDQREATEASTARIVALDEDIATLTARVEALQDGEASKIMARRNFDLAEPGEEVYRLTQPDADPIPVPSGWPFHRVADDG